MKQIINRRKYDTETAIKLAEISEGTGFDRYQEALYKKPKSGELFFAGEGGPASKYAECTGINEWSGGSKIIPTTYEEAREWAERHLDADDYLKLFEAEDDEDTKNRINIVLPASIHEKGKKAAEAAGLHFSAYLEKLIRENA